MKIGECMYNPPTVIERVQIEGGRVYNRWITCVRPEVNCIDYCSHFSKRVQTGGTCRYCKYFRLYEYEKEKEK